MNRKEFLELNPNFKYQAEPGYELIANSDLTAFMIMPTLDYKLQKARREIAEGKRLIREGNPGNTPIERYKRAKDIENRQ